MLLVSVLVQRIWALQSAMTAELTREIARCKQQLKRQEEEQGRAGLTLRMVRVVLCIYLLSGRADLAVACVGAFQRKRKRPGDAVALPDIVQWYESWPLGDLLTLGDPENEYDKRVKAEAERFISEFSTAAWVCQVNYDKRVAVPTLTLVQRHQRELVRRGLPASHALSSSAAGVDGQGGRPGRYMRLWAQRFRRRWNLTYGRLPNRSDLPAEELHAKATGVRPCKAASDKGVRVPNISSGPPNRP